MRSLTLSALAVSLAVSCASAQQMLRKEPAQYAGTVRASRVEVRPPGVRLGLRKAREFALAPLSASESARLAGPDTRLKIAVHRDVASEALSRGEWETTQEGSRVWRMALRSPGSEGIRVQFTNFNAGKGKVWLHDGEHIAGPYTGRGDYDNGTFWTATVFSESVTLEYEPDAESSQQDGAPPFEIHTISHRTRPAANGRTALAAPDASRGDPADFCHLDPNCYTEWQPAMKMVANITFEDAGVAYVCSGTLIGTRDNSFKPYLLTAGHCINNENSARSLEAFWTYQTASCTATPPATRENSEKSAVGGHLLATAPIGQGDYSLVLLKDVPADVTFAGWDITDPSVGTPVTGVHHPKGSWKRISFGERIPSENIVVDDQLASADRYFDIVWEKGRTEQGSSGSPLFSSPGVLIGTLTYGFVSQTLTACEISPAVAGYSKFSGTYLALQEYLENLPSALVVPEKSGISYLVQNRNAPPAQTVRLTTQSNGEVAYKLRADAPWIKVSVPSGIVSAGKPSPVNVTVDSDLFDRPGAYTGTVTVLSGSAPPQFLNVTATVKVDKSNVSVSVSPTPVVASAGQYSFQIRLTESAGVATRITSVRMNGVDYSSSIKDWFGSDMISANGSAVAPLEGAGLFPRGDQYFEFRGVDEGSGQTWYRVVAVPFQ